MARPKSSVFSPCERSSDPSANERLDVFTSRTATTIGYDPAEDSFP
jgi:hypothetical protein